MIAPAHHFHIISEWNSFLNASSPKFYVDPTKRMIAGPDGHLEVIDYFSEYPGDL